ncbi:MSC_0619 family F1-like ATPase alpha subunit [Ureaplasma canigenitalium]|uniref:MSC_0619 family F1-like ATPase alpha subunit n=1 Tax=Ureaplasma canigenitalium TaxID=42092 RepID=UPI0004E1C81D|nr:ATP F0F1 synthase subunit alpha [Ureaplasma canigenitalium]
MNNLNNKPKVNAVFGYIIEVVGEYPYRQKQIFKTKNVDDARLILISASSDKAYLLLDNGKFDIKVGDELIEIEVSNHIYTSDEQFGNVIDINGNIVLPIQKKVVVDTNGYSSPTFGSTHDLMKVKTLDTQLYTGIVVVDLLIPIGKGQRELIIGDRGTGKTHMALNTIINQSRRGVKSIYVSIGQKREDISRIYSVLKHYDAMKNTIIIDAPSTSAYQQYLAPYIGMAHAENISHKDDVLIIFDDLTKHANIFREIALLTDKPVGKEAMPGDMFFAHSSLLERAGSFKDKKTITALPIIKTVDGDITSLIASNVISITDGQIVTSSDLYAQGVLPAINIDLSVSRTGSSVQTRTITKVAGEVNKTFRAYKRHLKLANLDYDFNKETTALLKKGKLIDKMFNQKGYSLYSDKFILLTSKLITWNILSGIDNQQKALEFINLLINTNKEASQHYETILMNKKHDEKLLRDYFAYSLLQYSNYLGLNWHIEVENEFVPFDKEYLDFIVEKLGDKK